MGLNLSTLTPASLKSKNVATEEYVDSGINNLTKVEDIAWQSEVQAAINNNATTIDGGKIVTNTLYGDRIIANTLHGNSIIASSIDASKITVGTLSAMSANLGTVTAGVMYNTGGNSASYRMKIDLNSGEIHIR